MKNSTSIVNGVPLQGGPRRLGKAMRGFDMAVIVTALALGGAGHADPDPPEARRLTAQLNADLLSHDSATETLQRWCASRHLAEPPKIVALRLLGHDKPADDEVRRLLHAAPGETIRYRRVALACGGHVLSNA